VAYIAPTADISQGREYYHNVRPIQENSVNGIYNRNEIITLQPSMVVSPQISNEIAPNPVINAPAIAYDPFIDDLCPYFV